MIFVAVLIVCLDVVLQAVLRSLIIGVDNRGVSFGLATEHGMYLSVISIVFFIGLVAYEWIKMKRLHLNLCLIVLGGVGNIVSRLIFGSVRDYLCLPYVPFCFNLSDVLVSFGVVSYILGGNGHRGAFRRQVDNCN